jgi:hypothetical protein
MVLVLVSSIACGGAEVTVPATVSLTGAWALQTYNGGSLPYTGSTNANGSTDRVNDGQISFDGAGRYLLAISIVRTSSTGAPSPQDFAEIGSYTGDATTGVVLRPNDLSGSGQFGDAPVPVAFVGSSLSFKQQGKVLTFVKK